MISHARLRRQVGRAVVPLRRGSMLWAERYAQRPAGRRKGILRVFNLDLHISVIADLACGLGDNARVTSWSISGHNSITRRLFTAPDPVNVVNADTWRGLDANLVDQFQDRYGKFLRTFDGFMSCYTPAFCELYRGLNRPTLVMAATRYEAPYTDRHDDWLRLDSYLRSGVSDGSILLAANNQGDRDYIKLRTGIAVPVVPSLCDYTGMKWKPRAGNRVVFCRSTSLVDELYRSSNGAWQSARKALGASYRWDDIARLQEVFVVPYNISTMTLFELATAGIPVSVPSPSLLMEWYGHEEGVLSELTFNQILGVPTDRPGTPCDPEWDGYARWWLDRADFYDSVLMPNVRLVDSLSELISTEHPWIRRPDEARVATEKRNRVVSDLRRSHVATFEQLMA